MTTDKVTVEVCADSGSRTNSISIKNSDGKRISYDVGVIGNDGADPYAKAALYYAIERIAELEAVNCDLQSHLSLYESTDKMIESQMNKLEAQRDELLAALKGLMDIASESRGVAGYHLNGDIAEWEEFGDVNLARALIAKAEAK